MPQMLKCTLSNYYFLPSDLSACKLADVVITNILALFVFHTQGSKDPSLKEQKKLKSKMLYGYRSGKMT